MSRTVHFLVPLTDWADKHTSTEPACSPSADTLHVARTNRVVPPPAVEQAAQLMPALFKPLLQLID